MNICICKIRFWTFTNYIFKEKAGLEPDFSVRNGEKDMKRILFINEILYIVSHKVVVKIYFMSHKVVVKDLV